MVPGLQVVLRELLGAPQLRYRFGINCHLLNNNNEVFIELRYYTYTVVDNLYVVANVILACKKAGNH